MAAKKKVVKRAAKNIRGRTKKVVVKMADMEAVVEHMERCCVELRWAMGVYDPKTDQAVLHYPVASTVGKVTRAVKTLQAVDGGGGEVFNCKYMTPTLT